MLEFATLFADGTESNAGPALIKNFIKVALSGTYDYGDGKYGETAYNQQIRNFAICFSLI